MSGPVAYGTPWFQRARYLSAPLRRPFVAMRRVIGRTAEGGPCSILVVDDGPTLTLLLDGILAERTRTVSLGKVSALRVPAAVRREMPGHDLALARVPLILAERDHGTEYLRLPWSVDMRARTDEVGRRRRQSRGTVASAYARWDQQGFRAVQRRDRASLDLFYDAMYLPFTRARFGEAAAILDRSSMRRALERGTLVWVEQDGRPVAAQLLERCGATLHTIAVGTSLDAEAAHAVGVLAALKVAAAELALETGSEWIDFGGCMPWLTDGVLQNKRQWGAELAHRGGLHRGVLAGWPRWTPAAAAFLALAPVCRHGGTTFAVTTATPRGRLPAHKLALPGIDRLLVVGDSRPAGAAGSSGREDAPEVGWVAPGGSHEILARGGLLAGADGGKTPPPRAALPVEGQAVGAVAGRPASAGVGGPALGS